jgi:hypothetical protein
MTEAGGDFLFCSGTLCVQSRTLGELQLNELYFAQKSI